MIRSIRTAEIIAIHSQADKRSVHLSPVNKQRFLSSARKVGEISCRSSAAAPVKSYACKRNSKTNRSLYPMFKFTHQLLCLCTPNWIYSAVARKRTEVAYSTNIHHVNHPDQPLPCPSRAEVSSFPADVSLLFHWPHSLRSYNPARAPSIAPHAPRL